MCGAVRAIHPFSTSTKVPEKLFVSICSALSITNNVLPMTHVGLDNFDLVSILVSQVMLSDDDDRFRCAESLPGRA